MRSEGWRGRGEAGGEGEVGAKRVRERERQDTEFAIGAREEKRDAAGNGFRELSPARRSARFFAFRSISRSIRRLGEQFLTLTSCKPERANEDIPPCAVIVISRELHVEYLS